ncbi:hypothetical protein B0O80DRAFT_448493 [Mortierella sp. GBAus27b]|nr:hypothetical protein BGX31_011020 [Mortierella sp. GBA43]KAI8356005.1 hypothetical protein B0O80DRAFT_448493 [Mortierella sp. GBAus27b]
MFDIQELDDMVYLNLERGELVRCAQVNKKWHKCVIPYLWSDLTLDQQSNPKLWAAFRKLVFEDYLNERWEQSLQNVKKKKGSRHAQLQVSPFSSALTTYGHLIQKASNPKLLASCFQPPFHISIRQQKPITGRSQYPSSDELLRHFYKRCHTLQVDSMTLLSEDFTSNLWQKIADSALHVRHLRIGDNLQYQNPDEVVESWKLKYLLERLSTSMESLRLEIRVKYGEKVERETEMNDWTSLKELNLAKCYDTTDTGSFWTWLWMRCGRVERLKVMSIGETVHRTLVTAMSIHMPNLDTIQLESEQSLPVKLKDDQIATVLGGSRKGWRELDVGNNVDFGRASLKALTEHFSTLEEFTVDRCRHFSGSILVQVLSSCPKLCALTITNVYQFWTDTFTSIDAQAFIDRDPYSGIMRPWSCEASLKVLKVKITDIPRPDLARGFVVETFQGQGQQLQKHVFERLARLTNLETLSLGRDPDLSRTQHGYQHWPFQNDCLEMSLESGLGKLSGLKNLKTLNVTCLKRNTRIEDVQWMAENWPKLEMIYGLDQWDKDKIGVKWLEEHFPRIQVHYGARDVELRYQEEYSSSVEGWNLEEDDLVEEEDDLDEKDEDSNEEEGDSGEEEGNSDE